MPDPPGRHPIPTVTQYATPALIEAIAYHGHPPGDDPNWATSGAPSRQDYARWCTRLCGMACLQMALVARDGHAPSLFDLLQGALTHGAYRPNDDGTVDGLLYAPFASYVLADFQLGTEVITDLNVDRLVDELDERHHFVIASVHKEIRHPDHPPPGRGGHLVLVTGHDTGQVAFRNPSGHHPGAVAATLSTATFDTFSAQRGIALHL